VCLFGSCSGGCAVGRGEHSRQRGVAMPDGSSAFHEGEVFVHWGHKVEVP
jgi:hypothetical protein